MLDGIAGTPGWNVLMPKLLYMARAGLSRLNHIEDAGCGAIAPPAVLSRDWDSTVL
jgi:hypothetical protein